MAVVNPREEVIFSQSRSSKMARLLEACRTKPAEENSFSKCQDMLYNYELPKIEKIALRSPFLVL